jgi:glutamyl-tRNA synthetase
VVDDHDMEITHVFRGDEWIATFPIHILLYEALGWEMPLFCHMPTVLGSDGKKLSKRHGATTSEMFRANGYLPHALLNYTALVGWSAGDDKEVYSRDELIKAFSIKGIHSAGGIFDYAKLEWMNGVHLRALSRDKFVELSAPFLVEAGLLNEVCANAFVTVAPAVQERVKTLKEVPQWVSFLYAGTGFSPEWDSAFKKGFSVEQAKLLVEPIRQCWLKCSFTPEDVESGLKEIAESQGLKVGSIFGLVRVALLGGFHTPPLGLSITAIGKEVALKRLAAIMDL